MFVMIFIMNKLNFYINSSVSLCTHLTNPAYGYVNQTTDTAWFWCTEGYYLQGPNIAHCNKTVYEWNEPVLPRCVRGKGTRILSFLHKKAWQST